MKRFSAYLDGAPIRRRLRTALVVAATGSLLFACWPDLTAAAIATEHAIAELWPAGNGEATSQAALDAAYAKCVATDARTYDKSLYDDLIPTGYPGNCHRADAAQLRNDDRATQIGWLQKALAKSLRTALLVVFIAATLWTLVPLAERR